ncbi:hypothetical protein MMC21_007036 [Puttea exsequens]|nr:hypothetical protein [Puttea exsequens]
MDFQGSGFFFYHYVSDDPASPVSYSHYLPAMYQSESAFNALPGIIAAIGIAGISNMQMDSTTMLWARQKHQQVLRCLNTALLEPKTAQADSTFMTVMLLGLFETVTCSSPQSLKSWATHVNGATAIAKARGQSQLQSTFGRQIFTHLRNQVLIDCIQRRKVVPQQILEWSEACVKLEPGKGSRRELELFPIIARLCHLRAVLEEDLKDDESLLTIAKSIDDGLINWADAFPDFLRYQTRSATPSESIYSDFYHVYPNTWVVGAWNMWRCSRILVHESMMRWLLRHPSYDRAQILKSETLLKHTNEDICASVPFVFGESHKDDPTPYVPRAAAGMTLLWPLYLAATMDTTPPSMRAWCLVQLERLGNAVGIHQATSLAQVLRSEKEITAWTRFDKQRPGEEVKEW